MPVSEKRRAQLRAADKRYRERHPGRRAEIQALHRKRNPGSQATAMRKWKLHSTYGLSLAEFNALLEQQDRLCGICRLAMEKVAIDHDHTTGVVRGLLCNNCNVGLGMFNDDSARLLRAMEYLERRTPS